MGRELKVQGEEMENEESTARAYSHAPRTYALSGKILLSALVVLLAVVFFILCLHIYARCFLLRQRRNQLRRDASRRQRRRQSRLVIVGENPAVSELVPHHGLDASTLRSLPFFIFSAKSHPDPEEENMECAVCLSEFQEGEMGRLLPKCNHSFHIDCIDMWFLTHSTCPLCRAAVQSQAPPLQQHVSTGFAVVLLEPETGAEGSSSSRPCEQCRVNEENRQSNSSSSSLAISSSSSSLASSGPFSRDSTSSFRKKALGCAEIRIDVPGRGETLEGESSSASPGGQGLKSPGSRIMSLKRILSRERRCSPRALSCSSPREDDLERGDGDDQEFPLRH